MELPKISADNAKSLLSVYYVARDQSIFMGVQVEELDRLYSREEKLQVKCKSLAKELRGIKEENQRLLS